MVILYFIYVNIFQLLVFHLFSFSVDFSTLVLSDTNNKFFNDNSMIFRSVLLILLFVLLKIFIMMDYKGILPCFFGGNISLLFSNIFNELMIVWRVSSGRIKSSMYPFSAKV